MNGQYQPGDIVFGNWEITRLIGEGSYGRVFEAEREDFGRVYKAAVKIITIPQNQGEIQSVMADSMDAESITAYFKNFVAELVDEVALMSKLKGNSNIVSYEDHTVVQHTNKIGWDIFVRMELLTPLQNYFIAQSITRHNVMKFGIDMCRALELCQKYNIIHRDIKPENIFVSENGDFKLGDFGIARTVEKTTSGLSKKGTYTYMAPEIYRGEPYGPNVDIYSLGIVLYRMMNDNRAPFMPDYPNPITHSDREVALNKRINGAQLPLPKNSDGRLTEIIMKACAYDSKERYSSPMQMREELEAILYDQKDGKVIYPKGDQVPVKSIEYADSDPQRAGQTTAEQTAAVFGNMGGCPKCGAPLMGNMEFCAKCGVKINRQPQQERAPHPMQQTQPAQLSPQSWQQYPQQPPPQQQHIPPGLPGDQHSRHKKRRNILIIAACAAIVVLAAAVVLIFFIGKDRDNPASGDGINNTGTNDPGANNGQAHDNYVSSITGIGGEMQINGDTEFTFTPNMAGFWIFRMSGNTGGSPSLRIDAPNRLIFATDINRGKGPDSVFQADLEKGVAYKVSIGFVAGEEIGSYLLSVEYFGMDAGNIIPSNGGEIEIDYMQEYLFTPEISGFWEFSTSDNDGHEALIMVNDDDGNYIDARSGNAAGKNATLTLNLNAGETYHVYTGFTTGEGGFILTVEHIRKAANYLKPDRTINGNGGVYEVSGATVFEFTPDRTDFWLIYTSDDNDSDPYLILYDSDGMIICEDDDGAEKGNALLTALIEEDKTYYISAAFYGYGTGNFKLTVELCKVIPSSTRDVKVTGTTAFLFTPNKAGTWVFQTSGNGEHDPVMSIRDNKGNIIAEDDDNGEGSNASISIELEEREIYYVCVYFFRDDGTGNCDLSVFRK